MFDRDGGRYAAVLITLIAALFLSFWAYLEVQIASLERANAYQEYADEAGAKQQEAADKIANECATGPIDRLRECLSKQIATYQHIYTNNKDLEAQQVMAFWAEWMVYVTVAGIVVSAFGLIALVVSLSIAWRAVDLTNKQLIVDNRPWIEITETENEGNMRIIGDKPHINIQVTIKNVGKSVAVDVQNRLVALHRGENVDDARTRIIPNIASKLLTVRHRNVALFPGREIPYKVGRSEHRGVTVAMPDVSLMYVPVIFYRSPLSDQVFWTAAQIHCFARGPWLDQGDELSSEFEGRALLIRSVEMDLAV